MKKKSLYIKFFIVFFILVVLSSISSKGNVLSPEYGPLLNKEVSEGDVLLVLKKDDKKIKLRHVTFYKNYLRGYIIDSKTRNLVARNSRKIPNDEIKSIVISESRSLLTNIGIWLLRILYLLIFVPAKIIIINSQ
jgi:hypothetical protein